MRKLIIVFFLLINLSVLAQVKTQTIKGRVVDSKTQAGIAYTNIGVEGTFFGTASDAQGFFELKVPTEYQNENLFFSAVGYQNVTLHIPELVKQDFNTIQLEEQSYSINDIDVEAQSRVLFRVLKSAAKNTPQNYLNGPLGLKFYYVETMKNGSSTEQKREAVVNLYDETGYSSPSVVDAYKNRNYEFAQVKKNFDSYSFPSGQTGFEELLEMDVVRMANSLLNEKLLNDYDLQMKSVSQYEGDSVWVISYKTAKTDVAHSGDFYATSLKGKIYVSKDNYQVLRNECVVESTKNDPQNRSLATKGNDQTKVKYHYTTIYKPQNGKYTVSYLDCDKTFVNADGQPSTYSRKASVLDVSSSPIKITGKNYFENTAYVESFWNTFTRPE